MFYSFKKYLPLAELSSLYHGKNPNIWDNKPFKANVTTNRKQPFAVIWFLKA